MSSSDRSLPKAFRRAAAVFLVVGVPLASACTVKPLYYNPSSDGTQTGVKADLSSISIKPVEQRYAQEVRNHLIFLFNGGSGQPAASAYTLTLVVTALHESAAVVQVGDDNEPTAGTVTLTARYVLTADDRRQGRSPAASARSCRPTTCRARSSRPTAPGSTPKTAPRANSPSCSTWRSRRILLAAIRRFPPIGQAGRSLRSWLTNARRAEPEMHASASPS